MTTFRSSFATALQDQRRSRADTILARATRKTPPVSDILLYSARGSEVRLLLENGWSILDKTQRIHDGHALTFLDATLMSHPRS